MKISHHAVAGLCIAALLLSACDGNSRPFEEAVEVRTLFLASTRILPPANAQSEIFINIGQTLQLGVEGRNTNGELVEISGTDRRWLTSNNAIATVDRNGLVTGRSNGAVNVVMDLGDVRSSVFLVTVSNADLAGIAAVNGPAVVERCLPGDYSAVGMYSDGTTRNLPAADWSLIPPGTTESVTDAQVVRNDDASATLTGFNEGSYQLSVSLDELVFTAPVQVSDSLQSISITPDPAAVDVERTVNFVAQGSYSGPAPSDDSSTAPDSSGDEASTRLENITASVTWEVTTGTDNARVSNQGSTRGQLTGVAAGQANLKASCGNLSANRSVRINDPGSSSDSSDQLSFSEESPLFLFRNTSRDLSVSTGSVYDEDNRVTTGITCSVDAPDTGTPPVGVANIGNGQCRIQHNATGTVTVTATRSSGGTATITINAE